MALVKKKKVYVEDIRRIKTECDLYILMDVLNLRQLDFIVNKGYKISGIFTNLSQLELELATNMSRFRLLVIDSGCGNFGNNDVLKELNNIISLCVGGNKCTFLTSNVEILGRLKSAAIDNESSLMIRDYDGILSIYHVLDYLNENYKGSNHLKESLDNALLDSFKLDLEVVNDISTVKNASHINTNYVEVVKHVIASLKLDGDGVRSFKKIKY